MRNERIPLVVLVTAITLVTTVASAQMMPLPVGPPIARTDGPSYGPAYPPKLAKAEPAPETASTQAPLVKPAVERQRIEPPRHPVERPAASKPQKAMPPVRTSMRPT